MARTHPFARHLPALLGALLLSACSLAPVHETPDAPIPSQWSALAGRAGESDPATPTAARDTAPSAWQDFVRNPQLRDLITEALASNRELRIAVLNVEAARAQYGLQRADQLPHLDLQASGQRQRLPADLQAAGTSGVLGSYQSGLGLAAFELDLFGRVRNLATAAEEALLATRENAQSVRISLISEVIRGWVLRASAWQRLQLAQQTIQTRQQAEVLIARRQQAGLASALDLEEARSLSAATQAAAERAQRELEHSENALRRLLGRKDGPLPPATALDETLLAAMQPGLPSSLLNQRPDIRAAEHQLRARNASIGAARAAFFPSISLTGFLGSASSELSGLFATGSRSWNFMPQLSLPIFAGGRSLADLDLARARKDIAIAQYESTVQTAFREVSDALIANASLQREETALRKRYTAGQHSLRLAAARYRAGMDSHLRYLDAQRTDYGNHAELIDSLSQRLLAQISLYRALGGGWSPDSP